MSLSSTYPLRAVVAMNLQGVIGTDNKLPWHMPEDLKRVRRLTIGHALIMGRKTWDSIIDFRGSALPKRHSIVLTRDQGFTHPQALVAHTPQDAVSLALEHDEAPVLFGGAHLYTLLLDQCHHIDMSLVHHPVETSTNPVYFPTLDDQQWQCHIRQASTRTPGLEFLTWRRCNESDF